MAGLISLLLICVVTLKECGGASKDSEPDVKYLLYNSRIDNWIPMSSEGDVPMGVWKFTGNTKVLVHGYNGYLGTSGLTAIRLQFTDIIGREYAKLYPNLNLILVDWTKLSTHTVPGYHISAKNVIPAGNAAFQFLRNLKMTGAISDFGSVHMIGFSLGAHVCGTAGHLIHKFTGGKKLGRITGLDPAGPGFTLTNGKRPSDLSTILDYSDADFVDIIHCNMGRTLPSTKYVPLTPFVKGNYGSDLQAGHADFYINGGQNQPYTCSKFKDKLACSHQISILFYALAVKEPTEHFGCSCDSWERFEEGLCRCTYPGNGMVIGELTSPYTRGRYYLQITNPVAPDYFY